MLSGLDSPRQEPFPALPFPALPFQSSAPNQSKAPCVECVLNVEHELSPSFYGRRGKRHKCLKWAVSSELNQKLFFSSRAEKLVITQSVVGALSWGGLIQVKPKTGKLAIL